MPKRWRKTTLAGALALAAGLMLGGCGDDEAPASALPPPTVTVVTLAQSEIVGGADFVGRLEATDHVELRARLQGFIEEILFTDGQTVSAGDLLFIVDPDPFEAAVQLAQANVAKAQALVTQTRSQLDRTQTLFGQGNISAAKLDEDRAAQQRAGAELQATRAQLRLAEIEFSYTSILAPISGRIGQAAFSVGALVDTGSGPLAEITSLDPIYVTFAVSETVMIEVRRARLEMGLDAAFDASTGIESDVVPRIRLPDGNFYDHPGVIDFVDSNVDRRTATVSIRAVFPNPEQLLSPGQFVTVALEDKEPRKVLTVPQSAVQEDRDGTFVLTVDGEGMVAQTRITIEGENSTDYIVANGLAPGDTVIVQGLQKVRAGVPVNAVQAGSPGN